MNGSGHSGTLVVFAAASLNAAFDKIGGQFEKANPGATVKFNYAGSSSLVTSIKQGAPADVFASANTQNMTAITDEHLASGTPKVFARDQAEIMVEAGTIAQTGTPAEVTARPRSSYVADLTGVNLLQGTARGTAIEPGLPRTARSGHRHQPVVIQQARHRAHRGGPAHETRQLSREAMHAARRGPGRRLPHNRHHNRGQPSPYSLSGPR